MVVMGGGAVLGGGVMQGGVQIEDVGNIPNALTHRPEVERHSPDTHLYRPVHDGGRQAFGPVGGDDPGQALKVPRQGVEVSGPQQ